MKRSYTDQAKVFKAFCDEKRLSILEILRGGELCACDLLAKLDMGQSGLSYHMKILVESGIVESWQVGKWTHYSLSTQGSQDAQKLLSAITTPNETKTNISSCDI